MSNQRVINRKLSQTFRMRGLQIRPDAMQPLLELLQADEDWENTLQAMMRQLEGAQLKDGCVDAAAIESALGTLAAQGSATMQLPFRVIDAFAMQPLRYDAVRKHLIPQAGRAALHATPKDRCTILSLRLALIEQRVRRHDTFKPPALAHGVSVRHHANIELTAIDALLGRKGTRIVLGVLTEGEEGEYLLEDAHASISLDLSQAVTLSGIFTQTAVVICEGEMTPAGVFAVRVLGLPPVEKRSLSLRALEHDPLQPTGAARAGSEEAATMRCAPPPAAAKENAQLIVISDLWLDQPSTLSQLRVLFEGYEAAGQPLVGRGRAARPVASFFTFVLCGNFASPALSDASTGHGVGSPTYRELFRKLAQLLSPFETLRQHAHFVFVPGPEDACLGSADVLPRAPLPKAFVAPLREALAKCHISSNPARLLLCGQEVVVFREELLARMRRGAVLPPNEDAHAELSRHLTETLVHQAHLCPLPLSEAAVYWQLDPSLWLHPAPDVLVLADRATAYSHEYPDTETTAFNPGSFATDFNWMVYRPGDRCVELSALPSE